MKRANTLNHSSRNEHQTKLVAARRAFSATIVDNACFVQISSLKPDQSDDEQISVHKPKTAVPAVIIPEMPRSGNRKV